MKYVTKTDWKLSGHIARMNVNRWTILSIKCQVKDVTSVGSCLLVAQRPSNMRVYLRDGSAQTILRAAALR